MKTTDEFNDLLAKGFDARFDEGFQARDGKFDQGKAKTIAVQLEESYSELAAIIYAVDRGWLYLSTHRDEWYYRCREASSILVGASLAKIPPGFIAEIKQRMGAKT